MTVSRKWVWGARIACVLLSALILWRLSWMVRPNMVAQTWRTMHVTWFSASVLLYGMLLILVALRWHLVLKLSNCAVSLAASCRYTIIGHLFYTLLFGWIGGDSTKAILYARRYAIPTARVLATVPFDRFMGTCGSLILAAILVCVGIPRLEWHISRIWPVGVALIIMTALAIRRAQRFKPFKAFFASFKETGQLMLGHPFVIIFGIGCGLLCQISLSAVLALNLVSISSGPIPLGRMLWTFPAVVAISALPITVGGLGAREAAAVYLFGLYGISSADAVSASLLSFCASLIWAGAGGVLMLPQKSIDPIGGTAEIQGISHPSS